MKRIQAACLLQTVRFQSKEEVPSALSRQQIRQEYENYKAAMTRNGTRFKILEENVQEDGTIVVKLKKQNNTQPIGEYFD